TPWVACGGTDDDDITLRCNPPDPPLVGSCDRYREPKISVGTHGDVLRSVISRDVEVSKVTTVWVDPLDPAEPNASQDREPQVPVGTLNEPGRNATGDLELVYIPSRRDPPDPSLNTSRFREPEVAVGTCGDASRVSPKGEVELGDVATRGDPPNFAAVEF